MSTFPDNGPASELKPKSTPPTTDDQQTLAQRHESDRAKMPPPASTNMFAPPLGTTYTIGQLLAYQVQMPTLVSGSGGGLITIDQSVQSPTALGYKWILESSLQRVPKVHIVEFRTRIATMDSVGFDQPMALPWDAPPMQPQGCAPGHLDAQVLRAAWQMVLQMVPLVRHYDLQVVEDSQIMNGTPTHTYSVLRGGKCENIAIVEVQAPGVVKAIVTMIESSVLGVEMESSDEWKAATRQLRMYATGSKVRDVLVMDESVGLYFRFPSDPTQIDEVHEYLFASTERGQDFDSNLGLSLRELVVFFLVSALDRNNVRLRDCTPESPSSILIGVNAGPSRNVLYPKSQMKGKGRESDRKSTFQKFVLGASIDLSLNVEKSPIIVGEATPTDRRFTLTAYLPTPSEASTGLHPPDNLSILVKRIFKKNVALVTDGKRDFVAKMFAPDRERDATLLMNKELSFYEECAPLQGINIPYLIGVYRVTGSRPDEYHVLIMEYIGVGNTIAQLIDAALDLQEQDEIDQVKYKLQVLKASAEVGLEKIHQHKVVHGDVAGRNMIILGNSVVLVDFGFSTVLKDDLEAFEGHRHRDIRHLNRAFEFKKQIQHVGMPIFLR